MQEKGTTSGNGTTKAKTTEGTCRAVPGKTINLKKVLETERDNPSLRRAVAGIETRKSKI